MGKTGTSVLPQVGSLLLQEDIRRVIETTTTHTVYLKCKARGQRDVYVVIPAAELLWNGRHTHLQCDKARRNTLPALH